MPRKLLRHSLRGEVILIQISFDGIPVRNQRDASKIVGADKCLCRQGVPGIHDDDDFILEQGCKMKVRVFVHRGGDDDVELPVQKGLGIVRRRP